MNSLCKGIMLFSPSCTILPYCVCVPLILVTCRAGQYVSIISVICGDISGVHSDREHNVLMYHVTV